MSQRMTYLISTTGAAGNASGQYTRNLYGTIAEVIVRYDDAAPATTSVTLTALLDGDQAETLLTLDGNNSAFAGSPTLPQVDNAGLVTGNEVFRAVAGPVRVSVSNCDELPVAVRVYVVVI